MARWNLVWALLLVILPTALAHGEDELPLQEADVVVHDFTLRDGEQLPMLKLHYTTLGVSKRDASGKITNAIILLHSTASDGRIFLTPTLANNLFGPGQPFDAKRYYVILPDGIGFGGATKPSDGLHGRFPHYGYIDQVEAQHALLLALHIDHVKLVSGISQGGCRRGYGASAIPTLWTH
jgi:homoserine O-acetyltransferase